MERGGRDALPSLSHLGTLRSPSPLGLLLLLLLLVMPPRVPLRVFPLRGASLSSLGSLGSLSKSGGMGKSSIAERTGVSSGAGTSGSARG